MWELEEVTEGQVRKVGEPLMLGMVKGSTMGILMHEFEGKSPLKLSTMYYCRQIGLDRMTGTYRSASAAKLGSRFRPGKGEIQLSRVSPQPEFVD